ncbi:membrane protein [Sulfurifustis variabilis]|uniref:Membrane protein n=1 Tax=Sulfurifustis variabilis TaxID=1675686 RepID=A0A1B4V0V5_9GAMM|nr:hypothetical protein [Sulfurifustis variabilis]BAU47098.1 membrane protein [Sulfurifustis variabilis]
MKNLLLRRFHALRTSHNHWLRKTVGLLLVVGGCFGFLPVLGYWMLPLGLALLAVDFPVARRLNRRLLVTWGRWRRRVTRTAGPRGPSVGRQRVTRTPGIRSGP